MVKDFRFGVGLQAARRQKSVQDWARRAEGMGYDIIHMADHLYTTAPFPMMTAMAMATEKLRVGTFVLNAGFYRPALLARDVTSLRDLSGGRFDLGLGAGYVKEEFEQAELPYPTAGERVAWLRHVTEHMNEHASDVPILIAGNGDKLLTLAAQRADIIGLTGGDPKIGGLRSARRSHRVRPRGRGRPVRRARAESLRHRAAHRQLGGSRPITRATVPARPVRRGDAATPAVFSGTPKDIADTIRHYRDTYGVTYITVQQQHGEEFAKVIAELR